MMPRSEPQHAMLRECRRRELENLKPEWFAPNLSVARALAYRELVTIRLIGQRWWEIRLTAKGRKWT